jgi:hypothetical protein
MTSVNEPLRVCDAGPFGVLSKRPNPDGLTVVTYPLFELVLPHLEKRAGRKLTPAEVEAELALAPSVALTRDEAESYIAASRRGRESGGQ